MYHHKIDLVIIASFRQSKNLNSFGLPIRWLEKILWHGSLWEVSHFQWHIRWIPSPTQQHQDRQREGPTSCLWGCKWGFQQRRIIKPEKPYVQWASGTGQVSINHVKLGARQGGQDVAATANFCISPKSSILPTQWRLTVTESQSLVDVIYYILVS